MFGMKRSSFGDDQEQRFVERDRQFIAGSKEIVVFIDRHTGIQYMTTTAPKSGVLMMHDTNGAPLTTSKGAGKRFMEKERQLLAGCKEIVIFVDRHTGVQYLTTTAPGSEVIMLCDNDANPLFED